MQIVETTEAERAILVDLLAEQLARHFGAPTIAAAKAAAEEEVAFAQSLCTVPLDGIIAVHRTFEDGAVRETFRTLRPREGLKPARVFSFLEAEGEDESGEQIDLATGELAFFSSHRGTSYCGSRSGLRKREPELAWGGRLGLAGPAARQIDC